MTRTTMAVMAALCAVTQSLPVGTNLALLQFLWMLLSGQLLPSRGALFPGLKAIGLSTAAIRRAWAAFRYGAWQIAVLLKERYDLPAIHVLTHGSPFEGNESLLNLMERYGIRLHTGEITEILGDPKKALKGFRVGEQVVEVAVLDASFDARRIHFNGQHARAGHGCRLGKRGHEVRPGEGVWRVGLAGDDQALLQG